jgi:hypothetical protein
MVDHATVALQARNDEWIASFLGSTHAVDLVRDRIDDLPLPIPSGMTIRTALTVAALALLLTGCSVPAVAPPASPTPTVEPAPEPASTAADFAAALKVATITGTFNFTEENDPNELLGRPNGYTSATVVFDSGGECDKDDPGVDCGATIEVFEDAAGAQRRSEYILGILKDAPILGTEYQYLFGNALLRVSGHLTPTVAAEYGDSFGGEPQQ